MESVPLHDLSKATVYFGYGSNLWKQQMRHRCPTSKYIGIARLKGYQWIIYDRGYANIVELSEEEKEGVEEEEDYGTEVWGLVYTLEKEDESRLDRNEGVPEAYQKEVIECELWEDGKEARKVDMLVYIDRKRTKASRPKKEYVYRMNMGIKDALKEGVPRGYVEGVMRRFIPEEEEDEEVKEKARRQMREFVDENEQSEEE